jgi:hypothetical protein
MVEKEPTSNDVKNAEGVGYLKPRVASTLG